MHARVEHDSRTSVTRSLDVAGEVIAYRELGPRTGIPLVVLTHLAADLDAHDPRILDALAAERRVVALAYRGVGRSTGRVRHTIEAMADDVVQAVAALGLARIDLLGMSMGGMVAQAVVAAAPGLVERLVVTSAGPAGGPGLTRMTGVMVRGILGAVARRRDPKADLFFTRSDAGQQAARAYLARLRERTVDRDGPVGPGVYRTQLAAVRRWGARAPLDLSAFTGPVLIVHGDGDRMVPVADARALARHLPQAVVDVRPDAGHGVVFQYPDAFAAAVLDHLRRAPEPSDAA